MVEINYRIVIAAIICLTLIVVASILTHEIDTTLNMGIVGAICLMAGVMLPQPNIDNKRGNLKW